MSKKKGITKELKSMCLGKVKYKYRSAAEYILDFMPPDRMLDVYSCPHCRNFHIGHKKKKKS